MIKHERKSEKELNVNIEFDVELTEMQMLECEILIDLAVKLFNNRKDVFSTISLLSLVYNQVKQETEQEQEKEGLKQL